MTSLWRHSRLTYYDLGPNFLTQGVELLAGEVWQVSKRNSQYFRSYLRKTTGGALWPPPPSGARVILALGLSWDSQVRCWSEKYITVSVKTPSVSSLIKYSTSKLTGVQNDKSQFLNIGLVDLRRFIACGLVTTVDLILPSLNVRWTFE